MPRSIFRQPGAKHFQLVHRSQRDPLINDPDVGQHVLKPFERENVKRGKSRAELEDILAQSDADHPHRSNIGEAAMYGVLFDDSEYDYMQHLRTVGIQEDGVDSVLIEAPPNSKKIKPKSKDDRYLSLRDLPPEVLPPSVELPRDYEAEEQIPSSISGIQPDMDPHLRQVLEALEDDAFVDDELQDDFFQELVVDGERRPDEHPEFDFVDHDEPEPEDDGNAAEEEDAWEVQFRRFKQEQITSKSRDESGSDIDIQSEGEDTVSGLPTPSVIGGRRRRRKGTSDASGYSMSSSSLYRTEALKNLDEQFDQMLLREYAESSDKLEETRDIGNPLAEDSDTAPQLITSRDDFGSMVDDFLDNYEILGSKMKLKLEGETGAEKLGILRASMGLDHRVTVQEEANDETNELLEMEDEDEKDRWDCETILTTYSNLENHPRLIRARDIDIVKKIKLDTRTGMPILPSHNPAIGNPKIKDDHELPPTHITMTRPRGETTEEKRARKQLVKEERQARRVHKKATKDLYSTELKQQKKTVINTEKPKMRKL